MTSHASSKAFRSKSYFLLLASSMAHQGKEASPSGSTSSCANWPGQGLNFYELDQVNCILIRASSLDRSKSSRNLFLYFVYLLTFSAAVAPTARSSRSRNLLTRRQVTFRRSLRIPGMTLCQILPPAGRPRIFKESHKIPGTHL